MVTVGQLGGEGHVEFIVGDVTEAAARRRRLLKPAEEHTAAISLHTSYKRFPRARSRQNDLWSVLPMSRQPSRMYRGFRMAAVPDAERIHTSSLGTDIRRQIKMDRDRSVQDKNNGIYGTWDMGWDKKTQAYKHNLRGICVCVCV